MDEQMLDSRTPWPARPRGQFIKCAEADGLRRGWPEDLANVYAEDEVDRARMLELSPSQAAEEAKKERLIEQVRPKGTILIDMADGKGLSNVPIDSFHDRVSEFIKEHQTDPAAVLAWRDQQRIAFQTFFAHDKNAALDLKQQFEALEAPRRWREPMAKASKVPRPAASWSQPRLRAGASRSRSPSNCRSSSTSAGLRHQASRSTRSAPASSSTPRPCLSERE